MMSPLWLVLLSAVYAVALVVVTKINSDDNRLLIRALVARNAQELRAMEGRQPARPSSRPVPEQASEAEVRPIRPMGL